MENKGFAFVTMASGEEVQAAKYDSSETFVYCSCRSSDVETHHKLHESNLAWKVRSNTVQKFFSFNFSPVSVRIIFGIPPRKSAGHGFVSFATGEEAKCAISVLDGKELLG